MKKKFVTEQENFWAGDFGNSYINRNQGEEFLASQIAFFAKILSSTANIKSVLELGANIGVNLRAIKVLLPHVKLAAVEINRQAAKKITNWREGKVKVFSKSIYDFKTKNRYDFVFTKGFLIHLNPAKLPKVYDLLYQTSKKYILIAEYYNPTPVKVVYREHQDRLFKRDFAGEMLKKYKDLQLVNYGFSYYRDPNFSQDDITWFLLQKKCSG